MSSQHIINAFALYAQDPLSKDIMTELDDYRYELVSACRQSFAEELRMEVHIRLDGIKKHFAEIIEKMSDKALADEFIRLLDADDGSEVEADDDNSIDADGADGGGD